MLIIFIAGLLIGSVLSTFAVTWALSGEDQEDIHGER